MIQFHRPVRRACARTSLRVCAVGGLIYMAVCVTSVADAQSYTLLDLGTLGGASSGTANPAANGGGGNGGAVNNSGEVVGVSLTSAGLSHGFRTASNSAITSADDLGTLGGSQSSALAVNDSGQAVGFGSFSTGYAHAVRTAPNGSITSASDLGALGTIGGQQTYNSSAYGINASGQAVGYSDTNTGGVERAFRTAPNGVITAGSNLGTLGGRVSIAKGINASGQTVGSSGLSDNSSGHAFRTTGTGVIDASSDLGTLGGMFSAAYAINDSGVTVGYADSANAVRHAVVAAPDGTFANGTDLGTLGGFESAAFSVNASGQVVGFSVIADNSTDHAFLDNPGGLMQDLNNLIAPNSGFVLQEADGINDSGQIAGFGTIGGQQHAFLLTPIIVPEPGGVAVVAFALGAMVRRRRRRHEHSRHDHTSKLN